MHELATLEVRVPDESGEGEDDGDGPPGRLGDAAREAATMRDEVVNGADRDPLQGLHDHLHHPRVPGGGGEKHELLDTETNLGGDRTILCHCIGYMDSTSNKPFGL